MDRPFQKLSARTQLGVLQGILEEVFKLEEVVDAWIPAGAKCL